MAIQYGGKSQSKKSTTKKKQPSGLEGVARKAAKGDKKAQAEMKRAHAASRAKRAGTKITATQFATNQLKKAGIKPVAGQDVKAQFRKLNKAAARTRAKAGLGKAATVGASSALAAGKRTANPKVQQKRASAGKLKRAG